MIKRILSVVLLVTFFCCENSNSSIYKTKAGEYASTEGKFIAAFPSEPKLKIVNNKIGQSKFDNYLYQAALGPNKQFSLEYVDYPEELLKNLSDETIFNNSVANYSNLLSDNFKLNFKEPTSLNDLEGIFFVLIPKNETINGNIQGKIFKKGNRIYTISYQGKHEKQTDKFMNSFRLLK